MQERVKEAISVSVSRLAPQGAFERGRLFRPGVHPFRQSGSVGGTQTRKAPIMGPSKEILAVTYMG